MAIGTWQVTEAFDTTNTYIKYRIACLEQSTSTANNSSSVRITINIWRTNQGYTTYGSGTAYVTINGTQYTQAITSSQKITYNDYDSNYFDRTIDIPHGADGKKTLTVSAYISHDRFSSDSHSGYFPMTNIPRQTSITKFTVDKYSNKKLKVNWQTADNVNKVEYSTDNGATFKTASTSTAKSGNFIISQLSANTNVLSPNTSYKCMIRVTRQDSGLTTTSSAVSQTTYKTPTTSITKKTETSIELSWSIDSAANYIQYSIDNGSWVNVGSTNKTSYTYTINNLSANSQHSIKTNVRRAASNEYETTNTVSDTTYNWPYVTAVGSSTLTIGNSQTLTLYNPLGREVTVKMFKDNTSGTQFYSGTTKGTSVPPFTPNSTAMLNSIPNSQNGKCVYNVYYTTNKTTGQYTYQINTATIKPTFPDFEYKDVGTSALTEAIANDQIIVQGVSNVNLVIRSSNKLIPSTGASAATSSNSKYVATFDNLSKTQSYSDSNIDVNLGIPTGKGVKTFSVNAYDARNTYNTKAKSIEIIEYAQPVVMPNIERLNGFETSTIFSVAGNFSRVTVNDVDKNMISSVKYRYKESLSSTWGAWTSMTIQSQGNGQFTTTSITLDCDNEKQFDFQFEVTDLARTVTVNRTLSVGQPLMFLHTNGDLDVQKDINVGGVLKVKNAYAEANGGNTANYNWHRIATVTAGTGSYVDRDTIILIKTGYDSDYYGVIKCSLRTNNASQSSACSGNVRWLLRQGFLVGDVAIARWGVSGQNVYADIFINLPYTYPRVKIWQYDYDMLYTLVNSNEVNDTTASDKKGSTECWKTIDEAAVLLHGQAYTAISYGIQSTNVNYANRSESAITWSGNTALTNDYATQNTDSTWIPVISSGKLQHTLRSIWSSVQHTNYNNNQDYLATLSTLSFWNGAYNNGGKSNLQYCYEGTIESKPKQLYYNSSGNKGTVTLSDAVGNYHCIDIYFTKENEGQRMDCVRIYWPQGKTVVMTWSQYIESGNWLQLLSQSATLSNKQITRTAGTNGYCNLNNGVSCGKSTEVKIFYVEGWK